MTRGRKIKDPKAEALAFRIWAWCCDREWRTTAKEIGEQFGISTSSARGIACTRGWNRRLSGTVDNGIVWRQPVRAGMLYESYSRGENVGDIVEGYRDMANTIG